MNHQSNHQAINLAPMDEYNQQLIDRVHPSEWSNPTPKEKYDLVVLIFAQRVYWVWECLHSHTFYQSRISSFKPDEF